MHNVSKSWIAVRWLGGALATSAFLVACNPSDSEVADDGTPNGGSSTGGSSSGGSSASGGSSTGGGSSGTTSGGSTGGGAGGTSGAGGSCPQTSSMTVATHTVLEVTWPSTLAAEGGTGRLDIWDLRRMDVNGTAFTSEVLPCGTVLPPVMLSFLAGGGTTQIEIPDATWDLASMPKASGNGTIAGFDAGSAFSAESVAVLIGLDLDDPGAAWPDSGNMVMDVDHDEDMKPGITSIPRTASGFVFPPTSIAGQAGDVADEVYLAIRITAAVAGEFTSCTDIEGTAMISHFDNHVVGCHVEGGEACSDTQAAFIDANRTIYEVTSATFAAKVLDDSANCADVRGALPP